MDLPFTANHGFRSLRKSKRLVAVVIPDPPQDIGNIPAEYSKLYDDLEYGEVRAEEFVPTHNPAIHADPSAITLQVCFHFKLFSLLPNRAMSFSCDGKGQGIERQVFGTKLSDAISHPLGKK